MHPSDPNECHSDCDHWADIRAVSPRSGRRVMSLGWKVLLNLALVALPMLISLLALPVLMMGVWLDWRNLPWLAGICLVSVLSAQVMWAGSYPEWPMNQWLLVRLRKACRRRRSAPWIETARMAEWVPRERWTETRLDTAEDILLIRVSDRGIEMEGDRYHYDFPAGAIIDAHVESLRPSGCFHRLHFVILTVRTKRGPLEFPLAYRDHRWSELRSSRRRRATTALCERIGDIATGGDNDFKDPSYSGSRRAAVTAPKSGTLNPYAAPRSTTGI